MNIVARRAKRVIGMIAGRGLVGFCKTAANHVAIRKYGLKYLPDKPIHYPVHLQVEISAVCNLLCPMCEYTIKKGKGKENLMSLGEFKKVLEQFPYAHMIDLTGIGEPFINPDFMDIIRVAREREIIVQFVTNGTLFKKSLMKEVIDLGVTVVSFSIDAATKETYEELRLGATWERMRENIKQFCDMAKERRSDLITQANFTVSKRNIEEMVAFVKMAEELGVVQVIFRDFTLFEGSGFTADDKIDSLDRDYRERLGNEVRELGQKSGVQVHSLAGVLKLNDPPKRTCNYPWKTAYIDVNGNSYPCCRVTQRNTDTLSMSFGNVYRREFVDIWNSDKYIELRRGIKHPTETPKMCEGCSLLVK